MNAWKQKWICFIMMLCAVLMPLGAVADLEAHFLDVGHGDCIIIRCDGETMIIDGGTPDKSSKVYSYLQDLGVTHLKYAVATHPDSDHIGGLPAAFQLEKVDVLLSPVAENETERFRILKEEAAEYGVPLRIPQAGEVLSLGNATLTVLSPTKVYDEDNNMSLVLRLVYGDTSMLFCGDAEIPVEKDLMSSGVVLESDLIKVSHHGSKTATSEAFVQAVQPRYAVISHGTRGSYPNPEPMAALLKANAYVYTTHASGHIVATSDGRTITMQVKALYVGNKSTRKFHYADCASVSKMKEGNQLLLYTREEALWKGFEPCKNCEP